MESQSLHRSDLPKDDRPTDNLPEDYYTGDYYTKINFPKVNLQKKDCMDCKEEVIRFYSNMVYRLAFARTGTKHDADEIFQEVFLRYINNQSAFKSEEHRKAWLIRVTINCSNTLWGSPWRKKIEPLTEDIPFETQNDADLFYELQQLPRKYREVIHLFYYEDMSLKKISQALGRKNSTVRTQLTRARKLLKTIIEEDFDV